MSREEDCLLVSTFDKEVLGIRISLVRWPCLSTYRLCSSSRGHSMLPNGPLKGVELGRVPLHENTTAKKWCSNARATQQYTLTSAVTLQLHPIVHPRSP